MRLSDTLGHARGARHTRRAPLTVEEKRALVVVHLCDPDGEAYGGEPPSPEQMCRLLALILDARGAAG